MEKATRPAYASWGLAVVVDFDNDGIADILWNGRNFLWVLRGTGDGHFEYMNKTWGIKDASAASVDDGHCFGDIDGDGDLDIVGYTSIDNQRRIAVYRNDLPKQHWLKVRPIGRPGNRGRGGREDSPDRAQDRRAALARASRHLRQPGRRQLLQLRRHRTPFRPRATEEVDVSVEFYPSGAARAAEGRARGHHRDHRRAGAETGATMTRILPVVTLIVLLSPAAAQDVRG